MVVTDRVNIQVGADIRSDCLVSRVLVVEGNITTKIRFQHVPLRTMVLFICSIAWNGAKEVC